MCRCSSAERAAQAAGDLPLLFFDILGWMLPSPTSLILVALLPQPRDLEIARLLGWYRIPLRTAPKILRVDYMAFYQPGSFGAGGGVVDYLAPVKGVELTTRGELLKDEPQHPRAREEYFKIQLGCLFRLPVPIRVRGWRRFVFFYTTGAYLRSACWIEDLVIRPEDRRVVLQALRERADLQGGYEVDSLPEDFEEDWLGALLGSE